MRVRLAPSRVQCLFAGPSLPVCLARIWHLGILSTSIKRRPSEGRHIRVRGSVGGGWCPGCFFNSRFPRATQPELGPFRPLDVDFGGTSHGALGPAWSLEPRNVGAEWFKMDGWVVLVVKLSPRRLEGGNHLQGAGGGPPPGADLAGDTWALYYVVDDNHSGPAANQ